MNRIFKRYFLYFVIATVLVLALAALVGCDGEDIDITANNGATTPESPSGSATTTATGNETTTLAPSAVSTTAATVSTDATTEASKNDATAVSTSQTSKPVATNPPLATDPPAVTTTAPSTTTKPATTTTKPAATTSKPATTTAPATTTKPATTTAPSGSSSPLQNPPGEPAYIKYEVYLNMSGAEQQAYFMQFTSPQAFFDWRNKALKEYEDEREDIEIDGDGPIIIG